MDTPRIVLSIVVLSMPGLIARAVPGQDIEDAPAPAAVSVPQGEELTTNSAKKSEIVLLSDGRIVKGVLSEEDGAIRPRT